MCSRCKRCFRHGSHMEVWGPDGVVLPGLYIGPSCPQDNSSYDPFERELAVGTMLLLVANDVIVLDVGEEQYLPLITDRLLGLLFCLLHSRLSQ